MSSNFNNLNEFLKHHKAKDKTQITHTSIGNIEQNIYPGKYCIPEEKLNVFYKLYYNHVFIQKRDTYLTEVQQKTHAGPLLVDIDFRYRTDIKDRQHCEEQIIDIIDLYLSQINEITNVQTDSHFRVYVLEKPNVNCLEDKTKDGIHLIFELKMDHSLQVLLRKKVLIKIGEILEDLPLTNEYDDVLDNGISEGFTNWQMYGSKKPNHDAYEITHIYDCVYDENKEHLINEDETMDIETIEDSKKISLLKTMSARNIKHIQFPVKDEYLNEYNKRNEDKQNKCKKTASVMNTTGLHMNSMSFNISEIKNSDILDNLIDVMFNSLSHEQYVIKETHYMTMALPKSYYGPGSYSKWIRVGWALANTSENSFLTWLKFSSQSTEFVWNSVDELYEMWNNFDKDSNTGLTNRSIMYWLKAEDPKKFKEINRQTIDYYIMKTEKCQAEWEIANVLYQLYKSEFRCAEPKNRIWYQFKNHRWVEIPRGNALRYNISKELSKLYAQKAQHYINFTIDSGKVDDHKKQEEYRALSNKYTAIANDLKRTNYKENIMKEAAEIFYENDQEFNKKLDQNPNLICFTNGVYDFENGEFRDGLPEDYITKTTKIKYTAFNPTKQQHIQYKNEINEFMCQLFPNDELREYMWQHLASTLIGTNKNQTFNIYNGCGRNGKSKLVELMTMVLGEYKGVVPISLVTNARAKVGGLSPELASLSGVRYAVMQEPSKGARINDGAMKELTGEDTILANPKYRDPFEFVPQFKLVVCTNNLFDIKSNDDGTWRRIRLCEFVSKFVDDPQPCEDSPYEFKVDREITNKFKQWKEIFMGILVDIANKTKGIVEDCEMVLSASKEYRKGQDYLMEFYCDKIIKTNQQSDRIKKTEVYQEFQQWYQMSYGKGVPKGRELYEFLDKKLGKSGVGKNGGWKCAKLRYDDNDSDDSENDEDFNHD